jgi:uncharacterized protein YecE (DUF72 family)
MTRLLFGLSGLQGKLQNYAKRFDLLEVTPADQPLPKASKLAGWREMVPPAFVFSVVLPKAVGSLSKGGDFDAALDETLAAATALQARAIVLSTPASVRPTPRNRARIVELASRLPDTGPHRFWEPAGIWEPQEVMAVAAEAGLIPVFDAAQQPLPPGPIAYTRIRALGHAARLGAHRIQTIAEQVRGRREAFLVVDKTIARKVQSGLTALLATDHDRRPVPTIFRPDDDLDPDLDEDDEEQ